MLREEVMSEATWITAILNNSTQFKARVFNFQYNVCIMLIWTWFSGKTRMFWRSKHVSYSGVFWLNLSVVLVWTEDSWATCPAKKLGAGSLCKTQPKSWLSLAYRFSPNICPVSAFAASTSPWRLLKRRRTFLWLTICSESARTASPFQTWWGWRRSFWRSSTGKLKLLQHCTSSDCFTATSRRTWTLMGEQWLGYFLHLLSKVQNDSVLWVLI